MKKLMTLILAVAMTIPVFAQFENNRQRSRYKHDDTERYYGLRLGLNVATLNSSNVALLDMGARAGLTFGGVFGFQLANSAPLWLETGLFYSEKGGVSSTPLNDVELSYGSTKEKVNVNEVKCRLSYLQVPIVVKYSFEMGDDFYMQPFFGGFLSLGVGGKMKFDTTDKDKRQANSSFDYVNRFDGGLRVGCGMEYQMVYVEIGCDFGLANIGKGDFDSVRNQNFHIVAGVNF
ncbi:MAG: PorT family protein [Prevotella sp.]|nr:PorT family protein [Prevotella sp.]MBQ9202870.1 PorT family protein [Prevotella sp.]